MKEPYMSYTEVDENRKAPRPLYHRFIDDVGSGFGMGIAVGSPFYFLKGIYASPKGQWLSVGSRAVCVKVPRLAGLYALWNSVFSGTQCMAVHVRQKEDPWNLILAGASTGGFMYSHRGLVPTAGAALCGGVLLSLYQGLLMFMNRELSTLPLANAKPVTVDSPRPSPSGNFNASTMDL